MTHDSSHSPGASVSQAASQLGLSNRRVRALIHDGRLQARRVGHSWVVPYREMIRFDRNRRGHGRPLSDSNSWALLALLANERPGWIRADGLSRLRRLARDPDWLISAIRHSEPRSEVLRLWLRESDLPKLKEYSLVPSGLSAESAASELDVLPRSREPVDAYASGEVADQILKRFAPELAPDDANVILRVPKIRWVLEQGNEAPVSVSAADLLDHSDARVRRAAEAALKELVAD